MPSPKISEHQLQSLCFSYVLMMEKLDARYRSIYAIPNGGHRHKKVAAKLKAEGVRAGELDFNVDYPSLGFHGARIEFKVGKNKLTPEQKQSFIRHRLNGYLPVEIRSFSEFKQFCDKYFRKSNVT